MGKPTNNNHSTINHFSHPHPLQNFSNQNQNLARAPCSACKGGLCTSVTIYGCTPCSFFLHASCSRLPQQIKHPADPSHVLILLRVPVYPQGSFLCNACGKQGDGFSYHCRTCRIDLHTSCALMPLTLTHPSHPHLLSLTFSVPYPNHIFSCDACGTLGTNQWLYRCGPCGFDSHILCTKTTNTGNSYLPQQYSNRNDVTREATPMQSYYPPMVQTPAYGKQQFNLALQNLNQQQCLLEQQRVAAAVSQAYVQQNQPMLSLHGRNLQENGNVNYFGGNQLQGLFGNRSNTQNLLTNQLLRSMLGNMGGDGNGMSNVGDNNGGGVAGDGGGFDFGGNGGDFGGNVGDFGGMDLGSLGGMDLGGGFGDFSL